MIRITDKIQLWTIDNFASPNDCEQLIKEAYNKGFEASTVQSNINTNADPSHDKGSMKTFARNSYTSFVDESETTKFFTDKAKKVLNDMKVSFGTVEGLQVQRYKPGQKYNPHYDSFEDKTGTDQRSWTVMVYLRDVLEGGGTLFTKLGLRIMPKQGTAVIWNNLDSDYCRQQNTLHMGEEVIKGTKYIVTIWFRNPSGKKYVCDRMETFKTHNVTKNEEASGNYILYFIFCLLIFVMLYVAYLYFQSIN